MELLIAGGIALLGYNLTPGTARRGTSRPGGAYAQQLGPSNEYDTPGNDTTALTKEHMALAEKRWRDARDPQLTGIVTPHTKLTNAMLPFFRSAKSQNTNDAVKQTLLETFTGANTLGESLTGTYRKKREVEALFAPAASAAGARVTSSGTVGNPAYDREDDRFLPGTFHHNVLPAEQITVGRGVGVGPDVLAADGFHPMHRVLLKNVGEYKKNNLPGQVNHGAPVQPNAATEGDQAKVSVNHGAGALVYDQARRPMMPSRAAVLAPTEHGGLPHGTLKRPKAGEEDRFGNPARGLGHEVRGAEETKLGYDSGRDHHDRNHILPWINSTAGASTSATGAFTHYSLDPSRIRAQQREAPGCMGHVTGPVARSLPAGVVLPATQREMTTTSYVGGVGTNGSGMAVRTEDHARTTLRDTQGANPALFGTKAAVHGGTMDNVWRYRRLGRASKRPDREGRLPQPARINVQADPQSHGKGAVGAMGAVATKPDDTRPWNAALPSPFNAGYNEDAGRATAPLNKLPTANPRLDLSLAVDQLKTNPYASSLWTQ